jgi:hypothetical protein
MTYADARVSPDAILKFSASIRAPTTIATYGVPDGVVVPQPLPNGAMLLSLAPEGLRHSYLVRRSNAYNDEFNPYFDRLADALKGFLATHFRANP